MDAVYNVRQFIWTISPSDSRALVAGLGLVIRGGIQYEDVTNLLHLYLHSDVMILYANHLMYTGRTPNQPNLYNLYTSNTLIILGVAIRTLILISVVGL
jgi:hypothetical protein